MNHHFAVFREETGEVIRWGECPPADVARQALFSGEVARRIAGPADPDSPPNINDHEPPD